MFVYVPPFLVLLLGAPTGGSFLNVGYPDSEATSMPPIWSPVTSNISAGAADLVVSLTNNGFFPVLTTSKKSVMDSRPFPKNISEPQPGKHMREIDVTQPIQNDLSPLITTMEPLTGRSTMEPIVRTDTLSPTPKPHGNTTLPPVTQEMGVTAALVPPQLNINTNNIRNILADTIAAPMPTNATTTAIEKTEPIPSSMIDNTPTPPTTPTTPCTSTPPKLVPSTPPGTTSTSIYSSVTSPTLKRSAYSSMKVDTSPAATTETIEVQPSTLTDVRPKYTPPSTESASDSRGTVTLRVILATSPTINFAVALRKLLQQTCLLLAQDIPVEDVTVSWIEKKTFLPCVTIMGIKS